MTKQTEILIVQGAGGAAIEISHSLERLGYAISAIAYSREDAIKNVEEHRPGLVLIDITIEKELDGVEAADEIRSRFDIPVIYVTSQVDEDTLQRAKVAEPYAYILKPVNERELHISIEIAIYKHTIEKKLRESQQWLSTTLKSIGDAVIATDKDGWIQFMNRISEPLTGYNENESLGKYLEEALNVVNEKTHNNVNGLIINVLNTGMTVVLENHLLINADKKEIPVDLNSAPVINDKGTIVGLVITFRDVTERRRVDMLKEEFISNVSHELRTPLTTIREGVSQVIDGILGETTPEQKEFLSMCLVDVDRLKRIINNILDISKMEAGRVRLEKEVINIADLAKRAVLLFTPQAKEKGLELKMIVPAERIEVYADKDKITQVFSNLISNAIKFTEKGFIEISFAAKGGTVECSVVDSGVGIADMDLQKVFSKFEQFGRVYGAGEKGTGLGLSIAKNIIELHGGGIRVESKLNEGTKFIFTIAKCEVENMVTIDLTNALKMTQEYKSALSIILVKVLNFKDIRQLGEKQWGRESFEAVENLIKGSLRRVDIVMSWFEKEEIVVMLPGTSNKGAQIVKGHIKEALSSYKLDDGKSQLSLMFGYGVVSYPADGATAKELLDKAERYSQLTEGEKKAARKILVVDDEPYIVNALKRVLKSEGYNEVLEAFNGEQALKVSAEKSPDLIILDMKMPDMSGYEVIGHLKEDAVTAEIPIIILSGYPVDEEILPQTEVKAIPVISKPPDTKMLISMVSKILET